MRSEAQERRKCPRCAYIIDYADRVDRCPECGLEVGPDAVVFCARRLWSFAELSLYLLGFPAFCLARLLPFLRVAREHFR